MLSSVIHSPPKKQKKKPQKNAKYRNLFGGGLKGDTTRNIEVKSADGKKEQEKKKSKFD